MNVIEPPPASTMGCCPSASLALVATDAIGPTDPEPNKSEAGCLADLSAFAVENDDGLTHLDLFVDGISCAACIAAIEHAADEIPGVVEARVNMSARRLHLAWNSELVDGSQITSRIAAIGYGLTPFDPTAVRASESAWGRQLLLAMAVAGFAAANVMLLSVAVWSGDDWDMGPVTRDMFHWISALIALPAVVFAGQPFFRSAITALCARRLNMDVPISLAVILASAMSLYQTVQSGDHAYFDAAVSLLFFLLVGRYLDERTRARARSSAAQLVALTAAPAYVAGPEGALRAMPSTQVPLGARVFVAAGARVPTDGTIEAGSSDVDMALVTGEPVPKSVNVGSEVFAGTMNLTGPLTVRVDARAGDSVLAEIVRLMEAAEQGQAKYVRLADRAARIYAPAVHLLGLLTFLGWLLIADAEWEPALMAGIAVLIITCPCALALAVPVVQVAASGYLMRRGILLKAPDGLERLARIDTVVFDKTGTLTEGRPELRPGTDVGDLRAAAALAAHSRHPLSQALSRAAGIHLAKARDIEEVPGFGIQGTIERKKARLGHRQWCGVPQHDVATEEDGDIELWFTRQGEVPVRFSFSDSLVADAAETVSALRTLGLQVELLSGDRASTVQRVADELNIETWQAEARPADKVARLKMLETNGHRVLMIGDGLNDAPALAAGFASMSPAEGSDIAQTAADVVMQGPRRMSVVTTIRTARAADWLVKQNFGLALLYNAVAVPLAVAGLATPLVAAVAMSTSSILVSLNALRLGWLAVEGR